MFKIQRISDEERELIPLKDRCRISYNGYHQWELIRPGVINQPVYVVCKKCLEKKEIELPEKKEPEFKEF